MPGPAPEMIELAKQLMARAYAPYSHFAVGAALRGVNGKLYGGCNVENVSYPEGTCAETAAISAMVADGERQIAEVLVMASGGEVITPCGGCRQRLREFAADDVPLYLCDPTGLRRTETLGGLLPQSFRPSHLSAKA